ncbi:glycosyltransferase family 4 protein [Pleurocapsales cyanobacterium LEGE 06147]|nr:glycosyltransferase family 4 protein [Pleurocapsales cyanobacterium LEGE 06147]
MKILHLNRADINEGAARGVYWLNRALLAAGVESTMLVQKKLSHDFSVLGPETIFQKAINTLYSELDGIPLFFYKNRKSSLFSPAWITSPIQGRIKQINPDIINLHWICKGLLKPESLAKLNKPIVWTLRDMWGFTGGCHYSENCLKYREECGACPQLGSKRKNDLSKQLWLRKQKAWQELNLIIVTLSNWLADCAKQSSLFQNKRIEVIHNGIDELKFKPIPKSVARDILNLPQNKKIILFGAIDATKDERKGFQYLVSAVQKLSHCGLKENTELLIFGSSKPKESPNLGIKANYMGRLYDDPAIAITYVSADVTVIPSLQEAFGKTALESLACGTPVVSFDSTGLKDIVEHEKNGYRAKLYSSDDLARGIAWVLQNEHRWQILSQRARAKVVNEFTIKAQAAKYLDIYQEILEKS